MLKLILSILCFLFFLSSFGFSQSISFRVKDKKSPIKLKAKKVILHQNQRYLEAFGKVFVLHGNNWFVADYGRYYWQEKKLYLIGKVHIQLKQDYLEGDEVFIDLNKNTGWVTKGKVFLFKPHLYFTGEKLEKTGDYSYRFKNVKATACDQTPPPWSIKATKGYISERGYAHLWSAKFCVRDVPILYSPYLLIPAKRKRESGFLFPELRFSSRNGFEFNLPYYQVISKEQDFTFYSHYIEKRGYMLEGEYRMFPNPATKGFFWISWLKDKEYYNTEENEPNEFKGDGLIRPNKDRYWIRGKLDGFLHDPSWLLKMDLDIVSDQNYLREFESRFTGFYKIRSIFLKQFGRDIDKIDSTKRKNVISLSKDWTKFGMELKSVYIQNLRYLNHNLDPHDNPTVQRLPEFNFYLYPYRIKNSSFQIESKSTFSYLWRKKGINAERINLLPALTYDYINPYFRLTPKLSYHETIYISDEHIVHRSLPQFDIKLFTEISRVFPLDIKSWKKLRHIIKPEIKYSFIPQLYQERLPYFDSVDRISPVSKITYSITNLFTSKIEKDSGFKYLDFLYIKLEQSYDFKEASREKDKEKYPRRPFSDVKTEIRLKPVDYLSLNSNTWISPYVHTVTEHESSLNFTSNRFLFSLGYDYSKKITDDIRRKNQNNLNDLKLFTKINLYSSLSFSYNMERDFIENKTIKRIFTLTYSHQCWSSSFVADIRRDDRRFMILINLTQLGGIEQVLYEK